MRKKSAVYQFQMFGVSSNGRHSGLKIFKPEKNLEFFRLKNFEAIDVCLPR